MGNLGDDNAPPAVKKLLDIDEKYMEIEQKYQKEVARIEAEYRQMQKPLLDERSMILTTQEDGEPAIPGFWLQVLQRAPALADHVEDHDEPVLEKLLDIQVTDLPDTSGLNTAGFEIKFIFEKDNGFFENEELVMRYTTQVASPYVCDLMCVLIENVHEIKWLEGKDVTVETISKKKKGGGAKKKKQGGTQTVPRESFFRQFFRTINLADEDCAEHLGDLLAMMHEEEEEEDELDEEQVIESLDMLRDDAYEKGCVIRDTVVPFAVRWYNGDALPADDDEDGDIMEGGNSDDSGDDEGVKEKKNMFDADAPKDGEKKEECKQQ